MGYESVILTSFKMFGYKVAKNGDTRVIITLEIPEDALTNITRKGIVNPETATYTTNKAIVLSIEDEDENQYTSAVSGFYKSKPLTYTVGQSVTVEDYSTLSEMECFKGIYFFLDKRIAKLYEKDIENGLCQEWYKNGQLYIECTYKNSKLDGLYQLWYSNGDKAEEYTYKDDKMDGLFQAWDQNGIKDVDIVYKNGIAI